MTEADPGLGPNFEGGSRGDGAPAGEGLADVPRASHLDVPAPTIDIRVNAAEPAHYAPAGAEPYLGSAKRGPDIIRQQDDPEEGRKAAEYAREIFPDSEFSYIAGGRYGVVLADTTGKAFKVYRSAAAAYSRYEQEAAALQVLSEAGLAPRLHLLVDAGEQYRLDLESKDYTRFGFGDVQIPRQNSGLGLPVLVMDRVDAAPLESAEPSKLIDGFCKAADVFIRSNIHVVDTEVMVDRRTGETIFLDMGGVSQEPFDEASATPQARMEHELTILRGVIIDFGFGMSEHKILAAYRDGGLAAVRDLLTKAMDHKVQGP